MYSFNGREISFSGTLLTQPFGLSGGRPEISVYAGKRIMTQDEHTGDLVELRKRAEQSVRKKVGDTKDISALSRIEAQRLIHELQVYQVELEMQNEELRNAQQDLEESRDKYAALYDFAPVGYFTIDERGVIQEVNLIGAELLGMERRYLVNAPFVVFVEKESRDAFYQHLKDIFESQTTQTCEIELKSKEGGTFHARLESSMRGGSGLAKRECQTVVSDITEHQKGKERTLSLNRELTKKLDELASALHTAESQNELLQAIQRAQTRFIHDETPDKVFGKLLDDLLVLTKSEFGFISEAMPTEEGGLCLKAHAISDISWDEHSREMYGKFAEEKGLDFPIIRGLWGEAIKTGQPVIANDPENDPRQSGKPHGHPPLRSFLGIPFRSDGEVIGMAGLANRPGGYDQDLVDFLEPVLVTFATTIQACREAALRRGTRAQLFETNQRLHALMNALPVGVSFSDDTSCHRITGNPCLFDQFEIAPDDNISASAPDPAAPGRSVRFFHNGREIQDTELPLQRAVAEKDLIPPVELEIHLPSGRSWWAEAFSAPILDEKGGVIGGVAVTVDVTSRKTAEEAVRSSERAYRTLAQNIPGIVYRVHFDDGPTMEFFNDTVESITGFKKDELKFGRVCSIDPLIVADDLSRAVKLVEKACAANTPFEIEYRIRHKDGSIKHLIEYGRPILDMVGSPLLIDGVIFDITDRKCAEEKLRKVHDELGRRVKERTADLEKAQQVIATERQRLYDILETVPIMVCLLTPDHRIAFANRSFRERFGEDQGRYCFDYCFGRDKPCEFCESFEVLRTGKPHYWEPTMPDGSVIAAHDVPFTDIDGSPLVLEMDIDITEQRRARERLESLIKELERKNEELERFSYTASHDLKAPLVTIQSFASAIMRDLAAGEIKRPLEDLERIQKAAGTMNSLLLGLLELSRVGRILNPMTPTPFKEVVKEALEGLQGLVIESKARITVAEDFPAVVIDKLRMVQVLQNLLENAVKYSSKQPPPSIEIGSFQEDDEEIFYVKDHGEGIDVAYQDRVFELFSQLDPSAPGIGLGLPLVKKIIEHHNGRVWITANDGEPGSTVLFSLPKIR